MHLHFVFVLGWPLFLKLLLARIVFFIFLYLLWKADRLCCLKVRLLLASSYLEDLLVVFLLILCVNGVLYVPMKNGWAVRGSIDCDRNLAGIEK